MTAKAVAAALKPIYQAADADTARVELEAFQASELGRKNPHTVATFESAWERFTPFLAFPPMLRRVIYTTNSIESLNYQLRKIIRNRVLRLCVWRLGRGPASLARSRARLSSMLQIASHISLITASSLGKWPRFLMILRSW